jgi:hypothetical protein
MRRAKRKGVPLPLTDNDRLEIERFESYLHSVHKRIQAGDDREEARAGATVELYPEHLPH